MQAQLPEWSNCLFDEGARYFAIKGGRGSGKSRSIASALILRSVQKPLRVMCAREIQKSIRDSVKRLLDDEIERDVARARFGAASVGVYCRDRDPGCC